MLDNEYEISSIQVPAETEERISKKRAVALFDDGTLNTLEESIRFRVPVRSLYTALETDSCLFIMSVACCLRKSPTSCVKLSLNIEKGYLWI